MVISWSFTGFKESFNFVVIIYIFKYMMMISSCRERGEDKEIVRKMRGRKTERGRGRRIEVKKRKREKEGGEWEREVERGRERGREREVEREKGRDRKR